jgi:hypothetical protein
VNSTVEVELISTSEEPRADVLSSESCPRLASSLSISAQRTGLSPNEDTILSEDFELMGKSEMVSISLATVAFVLKRRLNKMLGADEVGVGGRALGETGGMLKWMKVFFCGGSSKESKLGLARPFLHSSLFPALTSTAGAIGM